MLTQAASCAAMVCLAGPTRHHCAAPLRPCTWSRPDVQKYTMRDVLHLVAVRRRRGRPAPRRPPSHSPPTRCADLRQPAPPCGGPMACPEGGPAAPAVHGWTSVPARALARRVSVRTTMACVRIWRCCGKFHTYSVQRSLTVLIRHSTTAPEPVRTQTTSPHNDTDLTSCMALASIIVKLASCAAQQVGVP